MKSKETIRGNTSQVMVSVICLAYNHEKYIRRALEGFLMQETSFKYEILIHDDASTDRTAAIIKEYESQYPEKIIAVYQTENQYSKRVPITLGLVEKAKGKYIAFCEGDDYWTSKDKLEMQVQILENHFDCVACSHNTVVVHEDESPWAEKYQNLYRESQDTIKGIETLQWNGKFSHSACLMIRKSIYVDMDDQTKRAYMQVKANGDLKWAALIAVNGYIYHIAKDMACYRCVTSGNDSWTARTKDRNIYYITCMQLNEISTFIEQYYNVQLDYSKVYANLTVGVLKRWLKNRTIENRVALLDVFRYRSHKIQLFVDVLATIIQEVYKKFFNRFVK